MNHHVAHTFALAIASCLIGIVFSLPTTAQEEAPASTWRERAANETIACQPQAPQDTLIRAYWLVKRGMDRTETRARRQRHRDAVRYRTENYGYFEGFGRASWNPHTPMHYATRTRLFDRPVRIHERIVAAAHCAEQEIARSCEDDYQPRRLSGIRDRNTYHNGEVSNHVYGIALDLDPRQNTCCNCVKQWREHPQCQGEPRSIFDRMVMPECWVRSFEKYGFYWLGHDHLMDTMHFEFLGDPERILATETQGDSE